MCGSNGCDGGTPKDFDFMGASVGIESQMTGTFTMTGNIDNNEVIANDLLDALSAALQGSKQCNTEPVQWCSAEKRDPETPSIAGSCSTVDL